MGSTPKPPKTPKFTPVNIPDAIAQALAYDTQGWDASDALFAAQYPGLVQARQNTMEDALRQLTGPLDPALQNQFTTQGIEKALGSTGGGNSMAGIDPTGLSGSAVATTIAQDVLAKREYDTNVVNSLIQQNPMRSFGLTGADVAQLAIFNTRQGNIASIAGYNNKLAGINAQGAAGVQTGQAISGIGSSLFSLSNLMSNNNWSDVRLKEHIVEVGVSPSGIPIYEFNYIKGVGLAEGRWRGTLAQDVIRIRPDAVHVDDAGYFIVDYFGLDVKHERVDIPSLDSIS
jgi:hypothetical protein